MFAETPAEYHSKKRKPLLCRLMGCDWKYNFPSIPNKCICARCYTKCKLDLATLEWQEILSFGQDLGTDQEMAARWF